MFRVNVEARAANYVKIVDPFMTIYHEYKEEDADLEVAVPITGKVTLSDPSFEVKNLPKRKVASLVHKGSYEIIGMAYKTLYEYTMKNRLEMVGPMMDIYLNDPDTVKPGGYSHRDTGPGEIAQSHFFLTQIELKREDRTNNLRNKKARAAVSLRERAEKKIHSKKKVSIHSR